MKAKWNLYIVDKPKWQELAGACRLTDSQLVEQSLALTEKIFRAQAKTIARMATKPGS